MHRAAHTAALFGRILLSVIFIISGVTKLMDWSGTEAYMASQGLPATTPLLAAAVAVELGGGLALLLGFQTRLAAVLLFLFLIPTTAVFHNFWAVEASQYQMQMTHFLKNLAIMGGLMEVAAFGPGLLAVDNAFARTGPPHLPQTGRTAHPA